MKYETYLKSKNLSKNTIEAYIRNSKMWINYLMGRKETKLLFSNFVKTYNKTHSANSTRLMYFSILSYLKFKKKNKLYLDCKDIKLPSIILINKQTITIDQYNKVKNNYKIINSFDWYQKRNWLIFVTLFTTGIRASELNQILKNRMNENTILIKGKGNKDRTIFLNSYLLTLLQNWKYNKINVSKRGKTISYKQLNSIIREITKLLFNQEMKPHDLRRSYATNLIRLNIDIKTISLLMGHSNINTTSRYIHFTEEEISNNIKNIF